MVNTTPTYISSHVKESDTVQMIHNNVTVNAVGKTIPIWIGDAKSATLLVYITGETGAASIKYQINVIEAVSGKSIKTYLGTELSASAATDYILVSDVTLGDWIEVEWTTSGTLNAQHNFTGVYTRLVVK